MNQDLQKMNSLITAIKLADKEVEKLNTKFNEASKKEDDLKKQREDLLLTFKQLEDDLKLPPSDEELDKLKKELSELEKQAEAKAEEKQLIKDVNEAKAKIGAIERLTKNLTDDIANIKSGKYNWLLAEVEVQDNPEENLKIRETLAKKLKIERQNERLTVKSIGQLIDACLEYYAKKYVILTHRERQERRKYLDDTKKWVEISFQLFEDIDKVTDESQKEFLDSVGIDFNAFNVEVEEYCKEGNQQILILMSMIPQKMKAMLKARKTLNKEQVKEILRYQVDLILKEMPNLFGHLPRPDPNDPGFNPEKIALIITNRMNDLIWKKFNVEEEDFMEAMRKPNIASDFEINQIAMQIEMAMMQIAPGGGMGGMDPNMGGMPGMGMGMPGMF